MARPLLRPEWLFAKGEVGLVEEPSISPTERAALQHIESKASGTSDDALQSVAMSAELAARAQEDRSSRTAAFAFLTSSIFWLLLGSLAGLIASEKLTEPDFLTGSAWLTFGRVR